nr:unnamed protein product [Callosobruchus analis]
MEAKEKEYIVMFDEVKLKKGLDLNKHHDFLEGHEDFAEHGRNAVLADSAPVFLCKKDVIHLEVALLLLPFKKHCER